MRRPSSATHRFGLQQHARHIPALGALIRDQSLLVHCRRDSQDFRHRCCLALEDSPNGQELARRREIVRHFFNEFWSSTDEKPGTFAERLNQAEAYINGRLTARGEAWLLDSATRRQLGLPPQSNRG